MRPTVAERVEYEGVGGTVFWARGDRRSREREREREQERGRESERERESTRASADEGTRNPAHAVAKRDPWPCQLM